MDEPQRLRIRDDLQGLFKGELLFDDLSRLLYSTDASIFQVKPLGVAVPRAEDDLGVLVRYAAEQHIPLIARGAGTGTAGACLGPGLIVDCSTHLHAIHDVTDTTVRVQAGVTLHALGERLRPLGRRLSRGAAFDAVRTVGGLLATHRDGGRGRLVDQIQDVRMLLDNGALADLGREPMLNAGHNGAAGHLHDILQALTVLWEQNYEFLASDAAGLATGYHLAGAGCTTDVDLLRLLLGSEGTLALFAAATLRTEIIPAGRALVLLAFSSLEAALAATSAVVATGPVACELLDRRLLALLKGPEDHTPTSSLIPGSAEAILFVEYESTAPSQSSAAAARLTELLPEAVVWSALTDDYVQRLDALRGSIYPSLFGPKGAAQPLTLVEDLAVPPHALHECVRRLQDILHELETTAPLFLDPLQGHVHTRPILDLGKAEDRAKAPVLREKIHDLVFALGGAIRPQRGIGLAPAAWLARQAGRFYPLLRQIKAIFDPRGIFNPGKIVDPDPALASWPLRTMAVTTPTTLPLVLLWPGDTPEREANHCNGCGQCRTEAAPQRMCPIFRASHTEAATPRAKANLLRQLLESGDPTAISSDDVRAVADLCVNCKMCALECPAHVNIPKLMLEAKAANVAAHGLDRSEWFLARLSGFARWGNRFPRLVNWMLRSRMWRWLLQKLFGLSSRRRLPRLAGRTFLRHAADQGWTSRPTNHERPCAVLFVDLFANHFDPQIAEAAVLVLQHNGFDVFVPAGQVSSGIEALAHGDAEAARDLARRNLQALAELAREGLPIICTEPSAALMLRQDYLNLSDELDARLVAEKTVEFTAFLLDLHQRGRLRTDFRPLDLTLAHHVPCHLKALGPPASPTLMSLIPQLQFIGLDLGCSGMAGTFGLKGANYATSLEAGRTMLTALEQAPAAHGVTECSSCRLQMEDGARKRTLHPAQYLALAYGLLSDVEQRLREPIRDLVLR